VTVRDAVARNPTYKPRRSPPSDTVPRAEVQGRPPRSPQALQFGRGRYSLISATILASMKTAEATEKMRNWLCSIEWLPLAITALITVLGFNFIQWLAGQPFEIPWSDHPDKWVAVFTLALTSSTIALWLATKRVASDARDNTKTLISMERPYLTAGGDFDKKMGFRLDVENHGKTPAFMTGYDLRFAKLAELEEETRQHKEPRTLERNRFRHMDGISPTGGRKNVFTRIPIEPDADIVFGAVYYRDPILGEEHENA